MLLGQPIQAAELQQLLRIVFASLADSGRERCCLVRWRTAERVGREHNPPHRQLVRRFHRQHPGTPAGRPCVAHWLERTVQHHPHLYFFFLSEGAPPEPYPFPPPPPLPT